MVLCPFHRSHWEICTRNRSVSETKFLDDFSALFCCWPKDVNSENLNHFPIPVQECLSSRRQTPEVWNLWVFAVFEFLSHLPKNPRASRERNLILMSLSFVAISCSGPFWRHLHSQDTSGTLKGWTSSTSGNPFYFLNRGGYRKPRTGLPRTFWEADRALIWSLAMRIKFWPPPPNPDFLTNDFPSGARSRMESLTKENLVRAESAPTALSKTFTPSLKTQSIRRNP